MNPPLLADLMTRFLSAHPGSDGREGDVVPHEVLTAFRVDARTAWAEAKSAAVLFGGEKMNLAVPPEWAALVARAEAVAVPIAIGHYPQLARDVGRLIAFDLQAPSPANDADFPTLRRWAEKESKAGTPADRLAAAAVYRHLGRFDEAAATLASARSVCTNAWAAVHANESAALYFARGDYAAAAEAWDSMPESPAVAFNRGLVRLALGQREDARTCFRAAASGLPADGSWADLARLYLAVAEMDHS
ncbi:MAG TPA: hypothetical protein VGJ05_07990 [Fimbriiglobus sp.]|jgi:tetratricopeptide (TPR) repeat protein